MIASRSLILSGSILAHSGIFFAPETGGGGGAGEGTLKQRLAAAEEKLTILDGEKSKLAVDLEAANGQVTKLQADLKLETEKSSKLEDAKTKLEGDLKLETEKVTKLESEAKTAEQRAKEKAAAHGINPAAKDPANTPGNRPDGAALYDEYSKLKGRAKTQFMQANEKALMAYAAEVEKQEGADV